MFEKKRKKNPVFLWRFNTVHNQKFFYKRTKELKCFLSEKFFEIKFNSKVQQKAPWKTVLIGAKQQ